MLVRLIRHIQSAVKIQRAILQYLAKRRVANRKMFVRIVPLYFDDHSTKLFAFFLARKCASVLTLDKTDCIVALMYIEHAIRNSNATLPVEK